jgi:hypothetical protein
MRRGFREIFSRTAVTGAKLDHESTIRAVEVVQRFSESIEIGDVEI